MTPRSCGMILVNYIDMIIGAVTLLILCRIMLGQGQQFGPWDFDALAETVEELVTVPPTTRLFLKYGYPAEAHDIVTTDGYVLRLDRMPRPGQRVVLLGNAMTCSSACYCGLQHDSLAFKLFDAGFDVWLGNFRGCGVSINHTKLTIFDHEFWNYGLHEHGTIDLPSMLQYVVRTTGRDSVLYGGHSMAGTAGLIMMAQRPDAAKLVTANFFLGPVGTLAYHRSSALAVLHSVENGTRAFEQTFGATRFPFSNYVGRRAGALFCRSFVPPTVPASHCFVFTVAGDILAGTGDFIYPADFADYVPSGASLLEVLHYTQLANHDWPGFRQFNYGVARNRQQYGQDVPPDYDLSQSNTATYVYFGRTDIYASEQNMKFLADNLKNLRKLYEVPDEIFGHLDFVLNPAAPKLYDVVIADMMSVTNA